VRHPSVRTTGRQSGAPLLLHGFVQSNTIWINSPKRSTRALMSNRKPAMPPAVACAYL